MKENILRDIDRFLSDKEVQWYAARGEALSPKRSGCDWLTNVPSQVSRIVEGKTWAQLGSRKLTDLELRYLLHGAPGAGKTTLGKLANYSLGNPAFGSCKIG